MSWLRLATLNYDSKFYFGKIYQKEISNSLKIGNRVTNNRVMGRASTMSFGCSNARNATPNCATCYMLKSFRAHTAVMLHAMC